jgi:hypothetical protein
LCSPCSRRGEQVFAFFGVFNVVIIWIIFNIVLAILLDEFWCPPMKLTPSLQDAACGKGKPS